MLLQRELKQLWKRLIQCIRILTASSVGGDLLIKTNQSTCSVVQQVITADMSPIHKGTAMQHLAVEGKKEDWDEEKLKWQLFANMMTAAVSQFLKNLKHHYMLKDIE